MDWISTVDVNEFINFCTKFALCGILAFVFIYQFIDLFLDAFMFKEYSKAETIVKYIIMIGLICLAFVVLRW